MKKMFYYVPVTVVLVGGAFFGGVTYAKSSAGISNRNFSTQRTQFTGALVPGGQARNNGVTGQVISKDATSLTVKLADGGSKIVVLSPTAKVVKSVDTTISDLIEGSNVFISGMTNTDGSVTAQNIQIRTDVITSLPRMPGSMPQPGSMMMPGNTPPTIPGTTQPQVQSMQPISY